MQVAANLPCGVGASARRPRIFAKYRWLPRAGQFRRSRQQTTPAFRMPQEPFGLRKAALSTATLCDSNLLRIPLIGLLRSVRVTGRSPALFHPGDIDILGRRKHRGILRHLVIVKGKALSGFPPRIQRQHGNSSVIAMTVDRPLGKNNVRPFGRDQAAEHLVVLFVDHGAPVVLICEYGPRLQNSTRILRLGGPDLGTTAQFRRPAVAFAAIEIQQNNLMAKLGIAGHRPATTAFRVPRMPASDDDLQSARKSLQRQRNRGGEKTAT
jgi:hypothetical protein